MLKIPLSLACLSCDYKTVKRDNLPWLCC